VVTLAERHGGVTITRDCFETMVGEVADRIGDFAATHGGDLDRMHMLGTSGTVTTIAGVHLELPRYDRRRVDGCWLAGEPSDRSGRAPARDVLRGRVANPCIGSERADLVLAGCAILEANSPRIPVRAAARRRRGLREGMLVEMMRADGVWDGHP